MKKMFFDKCNGNCGKPHDKKDGDKSGSFYGEGGKHQEKPYQKDGDKSGSYNQEGSKYQERPDRKDTAKCNHGPNCHCGHAGCDSCKK